MNNNNKNNKIIGWGFFNKLIQAVFICFIIVCYISWLLECYIYTKKREKEVEGKGGRTEKPQEWICDTVHI